MGNSKICTHMSEACVRLRDGFPKLFQEIESASQVIGLRNRLIHGHDNIDNAIVWNTVSGKHPALASQVKLLIESCSSCVTLKRPRFGFVRS